MVEESSVVSFWLGLRLNGGTDDTDGTVHEFSVANFFFAVLGNVMQITRRDDEANSDSV